MCLEVAVSSQMHALSFAIPPITAQVVLPRFNAEAALELIDRLGVTTFIAVPTMIRDMMSAAANRAGAAAGRGSAKDAVELIPGRGGSGPQWPSVRRILVGAGGIRGQMQAGT